MFIDDWDTIVTFGKHSGKRLKDCPHSFITRCYATLVNDATNPIHDDVATALIRIQNRVSVTRVLRFYQLKPPTPTINQIQRVRRHSDADPVMFGYLVEYLLKYGNGYDIRQQFIDTAATLDIDLSNPEDHVTGDRTFREAFKQAYREISKDTAHAIRLETVRNIAVLAASTMLCFNDNPTIRANVEKFIGIWRTADEFYMGEFVGTLVVILETLMEPLRGIDQSKNSISVGAVVGVIDLVGRDEILDIKCCRDDAPDKWYIQLHIYSCMYYLRHGIVLKQGRVWNFLNGTEFIFEFPHMTPTLARRVIRSLSDLPEHKEILLDPR